MRSNKKNRRYTNQGGPSVLQLELFPLESTQPLKPTIMQELTIDTWVKKAGSANDYATGRLGVIIEINKETNRARVRWLYERGGGLMAKPIRTWVAFHFLTIAE